MGSAHSPWDLTAGLTRRLVVLHAAGRLSIHDIAVTLSNEFDIAISRNAVISKIRRLDLPPPKKVKARPPPKPKPVRDVVVTFKYFPPPPPPSPIGLGLSIYQLGDRHCRYPTSGTKPPYRYCGMPRLDDCVYCEVHCEMARVPARKKWI